jgi:hypothetical protein
MTPNPFLGVVLHWLGGLASGSFYVPFKGVKKWSWETYWMVGGVCSWIICPWAFAWFLTNDLMGVLRQQSASTLEWTFFLGLLWGFGGLTYGLTVRYLGLSLGTGLALGCCAALGTMVPPICKAIVPDFFVFENSTSILEVVKTTGGWVTLLGVAVCITGICVAALAGFTKESQMPAEQKTKAIKEFSFKKGIWVAFICGVTSAFFAFALQAGKTISVASLKAGYINGAAAAGVHVADSVEIPAANRDEFAAGLNAASFGLTNKLTFSGVIQNIETNSIFAAKFDALYGRSADEVGRRLAAYAANFEKVRSNEGVASTIKGLGEFSEKELAFSIVNAGGDVISLQRRYGLWQGLPVLPVLLLGGFTTNLIWCVNLSRKNRTGYQFLASHVREEHAHLSGSDGGEHGPSAVAANGGTLDLKIPVLGNYIFSAVAGTTWYFQFFFYQMGTTQMGKYDFASWTLHMSSIIIFATMWGWIFREWKGSSKKAHILIAGGIATLILGTINIGFGTYLKVKGY